MLTLLIVALLAQGTDHTDVVAAAKRAAVAAGVNVDADECTRFEVTMRVVFLLQAEGVGHIDKPSGNNCRGFDVDKVMFKDGTVIDILGAGAEGPNTPHWQLGAPVDPGRWRPALPVPNVPPPPPGPGEPPGTQEDHDAALHRIESQLEALRADVAAAREQAHADTAHVESRLNEVVDNAKRSVPLLLKILSLGIAK